MWKLSAIYCATLVSFTQGIAPLALAPVSTSRKFEIVMTQYKTDVWGLY